MACTCAVGAEAGRQPSPTELPVCLWARKVWPLLLSLFQFKQVSGDSSGFIGNFGDSELFGGVSALAKAAGGQSLACGAVHSAGNHLYDMQPGFLADGTSGVAAGSGCLCWPRDASLTTLWHITAETGSIARVLMGYVTRAVGVWLRVNVDSRDASSTELTASDIMSCRW